MEASHLRKLELKAHLHELRATIFARKEEPGLRALLEYMQLRRHALYGDVLALTQENFLSWQGQLRALEDAISAITQPNTTTKEQRDER